MLKLPPLPALRAFEAVARLGSVTQASKELHVTQSAISHQVKLLEQHIGIALIDRSSRRMLLTTDGRVYAYQIRQSLQGIGQATERVTQRSRAENLTIAVLPSFGAHWLLPRLAGFYQQYPNWQIELIASVDIIDFEQASADCAIRFSSEEAGGAHSEWLMSDWQLLVAAHNDTRYHGEQTVEQALDAGPILLAHENFSTWCAQVLNYMPSFRQPLIVNDSNLGLEYVRHGSGILLTRWSIAAHGVTQGELKQVTPHLLPHLFHYQLVWPNRSHGSAKLDVFKAWLKQQCADFERDVLAQTMKMPIAQPDGSKMMGFTKMPSPRF